MNKDLEQIYQDLHNESRYELLNYDKKQHLELLNQQSDEFQSLNQQSDEFRSKLLNYSIILIDHLNWEIRDQYLELLENYMKEKSDSFNFRSRFSERYGSVEKVADLLKSNRVLLSPDENSLDFGDLLAEIEDCCKAYGNDPEPFRDKCEMGEVEFRTSIEEIYSKIKNFLTEK